MRRPASAFGLLAIATFGWALAWGQTDIQHVQKAKKATALVELGENTGTAFCIDPGGLFVTNAHVIQAPEGAARSVKLVLNAGEADQKAITARVLRSDLDADLALLQVENQANLTGLELGRDDGLIETMETSAFGYPFGRAIAAKGELPSVSVNLGRITSLRKRAGKLALIQLDVTLNPGNSGGPVLDRTGRVIGVVQSGVRGAGINFAIPVSRLAEFLAKPIILFDPPGLAFKDRHTPVELSIKVISTAKPGSQRTVEVVLGEGDGEARRVVAQPASEGLYTARVVPMLTKEKTGVRPIDLTAVFDTGQIEGRVLDQQFRLGIQDVTLGELAELQLKPTPRAIALDDRRFDGALSGLTAVPVDLGGLVVAIDLGKATKIMMRPPPADQSVIPCTVVVREGGRAIAELKRTFDLRGGEAPATAGPGGRDIRPAANLPEKAVRKVPGKIADIVAGGGGRFLFLVLKDIKKLAVFDVNSGSIVKYLPLAADEVFAAAGSEKLILIYPDQRVIQRWQIGSFEKELTRPLPFAGVVKAVALGSNATGPLLVHWGVGSGALDRAPISFLDVAALKPIKNLGLTNTQGMAGQAAPSGEVVATHYSSFRDLVHWRASANGNVFGAWCTSHSPSGLFDLVLQGKTIQMFYEHNSVGHVVPGPDGRVIYTGYGGLYTDQLKSILRSISAHHFFLPSADANYAIGITGLPGPGGGRQEKVATRPFCNIYIAGSGSPVLTIGPLEEMSVADREEWARTDFTSDKRYHFVPAANLLVTVPLSDDQLVVRRVDIMESLQKSGVDYLFVTSAPVRTAFRRQTYSYRIETKSRRGGLRYALSSGPEGMSVSPEGKVNWEVPADYEGDDPVTVVVSITDASGQEVFHTFDLRIR
jgi:S1-C subfamily serine protease